MKRETKTAVKDFGWTLVTCGLYFIVIFLRVLFTTKSGQEIVEQKLETKIKALSMPKEDRDE